MFKAMVFEVGTLPSERRPAKRSCCNLSYLKLAMKILLCLMLGHVLIFLARAIANRSLFFEESNVKGFLVVFEICVLAAAASVMLLPTCLKLLFGTESVSILVLPNHGRNSRGYDQGLEELISQC